MPTIFRAAVALAPLVSILLACSSDDSTNVDSGPGKQVCPTTIIQATAAPAEDGVTSACHEANYVCFVGFQCTNFTQQAKCTCDGTTFSCALPDGTAVPAETTDPTTLCQSIISDGGKDTCPTSTASGANTPCKNSGQVCSYPSTCTSNPPPLDTCQCGAVLGSPDVQSGLAWQCDVHCP